MGFELKSVAAVVVGGVNIFGGSGSIIGVVLGTVLVDTIDNSLIRWAVVSEFWREALLGLLIMLAVIADTLMARSFGRLKGTDIVTIEDVLKSTNKYEYIIYAVCMSVNDAEKWISDIHCFF